MATPRALRLAVFDCDGTLVDSQHTIYAAVRAAFDAYGLAPPERSRARGVIGLPLAEAMAALVPPDTAIDPGLLIARYKEAFATVRTKLDVEEPLFPGALAALEILEADGFLLGVATGKGRRGLEATLIRHGLLDRFVTIQTGDTGPGKPHPDMLLRAMAETGVKPAACVMIGDTTFDVGMARAARVKALGVAWGYHGMDELAAAGPDAIVESFAALPAAVRELVP